MLVERFASSSVMRDGEGCISTIRKEGREFQMCASELVTIAWHMSGSTCGVVSDPVSCNSLWVLTTCQPYLHWSRDTAVR